MGAVTGVAALGGKLEAETSPSFHPIPVCRYLLIPATTVTGAGGMHSMERMSPLSRKPACLPACLPAHV